MLQVSRYSLSKTRLLHLLEELKANSIEIGSMCVKPGTSSAEFQDLLSNILDLKSAPGDLVSSINESKTGAVLFWGPHHRYLVIPPFPIFKTHFSKACEIEPLNTLMHQEFLFALMLVRLGNYGIGIVKGEALLSSKVGSGLVHARHRQGGSSSHRFERHREKQMETFFTRVCLHAREQLEPYGRSLNYLIYGGTKETVTDFRKQCHFSQQFDKITLEHLLNIREPRQTGLAEAIQDAWSSKVIQWD